MLFLKPLSGALPDTLRCVIHSRPSDKIITSNTTSYNVRSFTVVAFISARAATPGVNSFNNVPTSPIPNTLGHSFSPP
jgi:predicted glutamine amidotransferase